MPCTVKLTPIRMWLSTVQYVLLSSLFVLTAGQTVVVSTESGQLGGYHVDFKALPLNNQTLWGGSADVFLGIPYAQPPKGTLRFQRPQPVPSWSGIRNATGFGNKCPQPPSIISLANVAQDEDCLFLNIVTPNATSTALVPVMVFVHGGGFFQGASSDYSVNGMITNFASRGVVVVTLNYRLGLLGMFTTLTEDFPANLGLLDQLQALKFIQKNIKYFGGDPNKITLFGQSAGSCSVDFLTYSPLANGLFQQAIMESGANAMCLDGYHGYYHRSQLAAQYLCNITDAQWANKDFAALKKCMADLTLNQTIQWNNASIPWPVIMDKELGANALIPDWPRNLASKRHVMPVMIGTCRDEAAYDLIISVVEGQLPQPNLDAYKASRDGQIAGYPPSLRPELQRILDAHYINSAIPPLNTTGDFVKVKIALESETDFVAGTAAESQLWLKYSVANPQLYLYQFNYPATGSNLGGLLSSLNGLVPGLGNYQPVFHSTELFFLFIDIGIIVPIFLPNGVWTPGSISAADLGMMEMMGNMWTTFAKTGRPSPLWDSISSANPYQYFAFNGPTQSSMMSPYAAKATEIWTVVLPAVANQPYGPPNPDTPATTTTPTPTSSPATPTTGTSSGWNRVPCSVHLLLFIGLLASSIHHQLG